MLKTYSDVSNLSGPDTAEQAIAQARTNAISNSSALILLALVLCAGIISGCKKKATDYASVVAGMHQWSGIKIDGLYNPPGVDTTNVTFSMNITAVSNSSIAFANPVDTLDGVAETFTLDETYADAKTIIFYFIDADKYDTYHYDSLVYTYASKSFYWHTYQLSPRLLFVSSERMFLYSN